MCAASAGHACGAVGKVLGIARARTIPLVHEGIQPRSGGEVVGMLVDAVDPTCTKVCSTFRGHRYLRRGVASGPGPFGERLRAQPSFYTGAAEVSVGRWASGFG